MRLLADTVRATADAPVTLDEAEESLRRLDAEIVRGTRGPVVTLRRALKEHRVNARTGGVA